MMMRMLTAAGLCSAALLLGPGVARADKNFAVKVDAPDAQRGKPAKAELRVTTSAGWHVNNEFPASVTIIAPPGVDAPPGKIKPSRIEKAQAAFDVGYTPREAGAKTFSAVVSFAVCNDSNTQCEPRREPVKFTVNVK